MVYLIAEKNALSYSALNAHEGAELQDWMEKACPVKISVNYSIHSF
jgi:hypothetical protein